MASRALALGYFQSLAVKWKCSSDFSPMNQHCIFAKKEKKKEKKKLEKSCPKSLLAAKIKRQEEKCKQGRKNENWDGERGGVQEVLGEDARKVFVIGEWNHRRGK